MRDTDVLPTHAATEWLARFARPTADWQNAGRSDVPVRPVPTVLDVACWCGSNVQAFTVEQVRAGRTGWSCGGGYKRCRPW